MIIEIEKRDVVISQTKKEFRVRHLCKTIFVPETKSEADRVAEFVEEMLVPNGENTAKAAQMRDAAVASMDGWAANTQLECINRHLTNLRAHPSFDELIKEISQLITDMED